MSIKKKGKKIENFEVSYLLYPLLFDFFCKTYFRLAIYVTSSIPKSMGKIKEYPKEIHERDMGHLDIDAIKLTHTIKINI